MAAKEDPALWAVLVSPEAAAAVVTLVGAVLAAYWGGRAGGKGAVAAAQAQNRGMADQAAINARRAVYAEFARDARALSDGVVQYVMDPGPDPDADTAAYVQVLDRARWSYDVVSIEGPRCVRKAAKQFIDQAMACRTNGSGHASAMAAFNKLEKLRWTHDDHQREAIVAVDQALERIRRAARGLPPDWRFVAQGWTGNASTELRARWEEECALSPGEAPAYEDVAALAELIRDGGDPDAPLNAAVEAGYLSDRDASRITSYTVTWPEEDDPRQRVRRGLFPMGDALKAFVKEANRVLHPEEFEEDSGDS